MLKSQFSATGHPMVTMTGCCPQPFGLLKRPEAGCQLNAQACAGLTSHEGALFAGVMSRDSIDSKEKRAHHDVGPSPFSGFAIVVNVHVLFKSTRLGVV